MSRSCGECSACCKVYAIKELKKQANQWCKHCPGSGCSIYQNRPGVCRDFECLWLLSPDLSDSLRPDRSKVVLTVNQEQTAFMAHVDPDHPEAFQQGEMADLLRYMGNQLPVLVVIGEKRKLVASPELVQEGITVTCEEMDGTVQTYTVGVKK